MLYDNKVSWLQNKWVHNNGVSRGGEDDDNKNIILVYHEDCSGIERGFFYLKN